MLVAGGYSPGAGVRTVGPLPDGTGLTFLVGLPSRDPGGFLADESAAYIPGSGAYHVFLSPSEIAQRYGPSTSTVARTESFFSGYGLHSSLSPDGLLLSVSGSLAAVAHAFGTSFVEDRGPDGRLFFSHPTSARLPDSVPVSGVYGLGNVTPLRPLDLRPTFATPGVVAQATCATGPGCPPVRSGGRMIQRT